jgi:hypothetical protein
LDVNKESAPFWAVVISIIGLQIITIAMVVTVVAFQVTDVTTSQTLNSAMLLSVGADISITAAATGWLFGTRNGNGIRIGEGSK